MSSSNTLLILLSQLVMSAPLLLVYLVGMIMAGRWWRRAPRPAMFAMTGLALLLLATLAGSATQAFFIANPGPGGMASAATRMQVFGFAFMVVRAAGMALVVAAVFAGRSTASGFDVRLAAAEPPLANLAPQR